MSDTAILTRGDIPFPTKPDTSNWIRNLLRPFAKSRASDEQIKVDSPDNPFAVSRCQTVLVVDDDPVFVTATAARLKADGYEVVIAPDSSKAMEVLRCQMPDLVVLDVNLPDDPTGMSWDGLKLVSWMNRLEAFKKIPVVITTASDPSKYTRLALNAGAVAFFHKRMAPAQLLALVENSLARKKTKPAESPDSNFQI